MLILTLAFLTIITIMLVVFVAITSQDRGATQNYAQSLRAEQIGFGGLDQIIAQLQAEISDSSRSTLNGSGSNVVYIPNASSTAVPQRMAGLPASLPNLIKISTNGTFFSSSAAMPANEGLASSSLSTNVSLNGRSVSVSRWNKPSLLTVTANFPAPNWVIVTRSGPQPFTSYQTSLANSSLSNTNYAIGRYAYVVYDTSGLVDINVAGNPNGATSTNTGIQPFIDLTLLTNNASPAITATDIDNLIKWRNAASYPNYSTYTNYVSAWATNGFMRVAPGDTAFLGRQDLIKYAQSQNSDLTNALPFLTTFSREINGPTWMPAKNIAYNSGKGLSGINNFNYLSLAQADTGSTTVPVYNPFIMTARVQTGGWKRNNGTIAVKGEPLVKYRFPLDKLNLFNKPYSSLTAQDLDDIARYFGLDPVTADASSTYHHWTYPTASSSYVHTSGNILSLNQISGLSTPREPDFFELLQAGILQGSLGYYKSERTDYIASSPGPAASATDPDTKVTYQIIRIGANIIDQWKSDNYPTTISYNLGGSVFANFYGIEDLPYINQLLVRTWDEGNAASPGPWDTILYYELWNPHQLANNTGSPTQFQIVPDLNSGPAGTSGDSVLIRVVDRVNGGSWYWSNTTQTWSSGPVSASSWYSPFATADAGGTNSFMAAATDYREPSLITKNATPLKGNYGGVSGIGGWYPPTSLSAILLSHANQIPGANYSTVSGSSARPWSTANTNGGWEMASSLYATLLLQYQDGQGTYRTYATWEGNDDGANPYNVGFSSGIGSSQMQVATTNAYAIVKVDPRTPRFGPGSVHNQAGTYFNTGALPSSTANVADKYRTADPVPFYYQFSPNPNASVAQPFRMDMWSVNDPTVTINGANNYNIAPWYQDNDGVYRGGDGKYSYPTHSPQISGDPASRPIILHRPFLSVGELGYVYRDDPWRTLDLFTPDSPDAGLLDLFTLSDTPMIAGRINPNTPYPNVIAAMLNGAPVPNSTPIGAAAAMAIGNAMTNITATTPFINRGALVTTFMTNSAVTGAISTTIKTQREALIRALAESSNTRTWNFLIDIVAQSGNYPPNAVNPSLDNFVVTGERRYWLHVAIDRYTGQVVDKQLEVVNE